MMLKVDRKKNKVFSVKGGFLIYSSVGRGGGLKPTLTSSKGR